VTAEPGAALRAQAREWGRSRLATPAWAELEHGTSLLLIDPPTVEWVAAEPAAFELWLIVELSEARFLPLELREPLIRDGVLLEQVPAGDAEARLTTFTADRLEAVLSGYGRRALEMRWSIRHSEPVHDVMRRGEALGAAAERLPEDAPERIVRPLYLQAHSSLHALSSVRPDDPAAGALAAGEAAVAIARLACVLDEGNHPPAQWLIPAAAETELGQRMAIWLTDATRYSEPEAAQRVINGCHGAWIAIQAVVHPLYGSTAWFLSPDVWALRPPR
jgi:hypothetical protein